MPRADRNRLDRRRGCGRFDVTALKPLPGGRPIEHFCRSNFTRGIVTFHTDYLFMTDPGWDLVATGPFNEPKDNAYPLTGVIEADWLPYPFTMNWQILRPGTVRFEEGEPFCFVFPTPKQALVGCEVEIHRLADHPELARQHQAFRDARDDFIQRVVAGDQAATRQAWQRYYFTGRHPDGTEVEGHLAKLRLQEPLDFRQPLAPASASAERAIRDHLGAGQPARRDPVGPERGEPQGPGADRRVGAISRSARTSWVKAAQDAERGGFLCIEGFMTPAQCARLCAAFAALKDRLYTSSDIDPYWNSRFVWLADILAADPNAARLLIAKQREAGERLAKFYRLTRPIYTDLTQIVQWPPGISMPPHADNANPDGTPHQMAYRDFGGIAYLNDDYDGGELYFTALDLAVKPKAGMFLGFTAGFHHEHAVLRVTGGNTRLTAPAFFTFAHERADRLVYPEIPAT